MSLANPRQNLQDWFTQQWAILWGRRVVPEEFPWLMGPFGSLNGMGYEFIDQLAAKENLLIERDTDVQALIPSVKELGLSDDDSSVLSPEIVDFYENTTDYDLAVRLKWNPLFRIFGILVKTLFSNRLNQLNIPTKDIQDPESIAHEIITLVDRESNRAKYTVWLRTIASTGRTIYSGVYGTCTLASGLKCVKAVFPLPHGNATVIMSPRVGPNGELILESSGLKFGDAGFYFLLKDSKGGTWAQFIRSFRDRLTMAACQDRIIGDQTLTLFGLNVLRFTYEIRAKASPSDKTAAKPLI